MHTRDLSPPSSPDPDLRQRSAIPHKAARADLKSYYRLTCEVGSIIALLALIGLVQVPIQDSGEFEVVLAEQEIVEMEEIKQTVQDIKPPPPPRPSMLQVVSDDVILDDIDLQLDASLDIDQTLDVLPPPPAPEMPDEAADEEEAEIFVVVEQMPELIGGIAAIQKKIKYPDIALKAGVEGRVIVQFVVNEDGNVLNPAVIKGIGAGCDAEAVRVVSTARFKPGMQRGKAVKVRFSVPITFRLR